MFCEMKHPYNTYISPILDTSLGRLTVGDIPLSINCFGAAVEIFREN